MLKRFNAKDLTEIIRQQIWTGESRLLTGPAHPHSLEAAWASPAATQHRVRCWDQNEGGLTEGVYVDDPVATADPCVYALSTEDSCDQ